ncbi:MAG: DMT family transporter [Oliverpabstia sp.]
MKKEYWLAAYTIFCWGTLPAITKFTLTSISNMQVLFISSLIAAGCLYLYLFLSGRIKLFCSLTCFDLLQLVALGFLGNFLYSAFYYASLRTLPSADACIINYLWPIIATICAAVILHEKIKATEWLAILLSFAGVVIISTKGSGLMMANVQGVLLCVAGALCYGIFNVLNKKKGLDQLLCTAVYFTVTAVCSAPLLLVTGDIAPMSGVTWLGMLWLGVFIDALAIFAWGAALQMSEVGVLSNLAYLTPVVAMIVSYITLGEPIESYAVIGMMFVLGGCLLQVFSKWHPIHKMNGNSIWHK